MKKLFSLLVVVVMVISFSVVCLADPFGTPVGGDSNTSIIITNNS